MFLVTVAMASIIRSTSTGQCCTASVLKKNFVSFLCLKGPTLPAAANTTDYCMLALATKGL